MPLKSVTLVLAAAAITATSASAQAPAPRIGEVKGEVLIAGAGGLSPAKAGDALAPGQRIVARTGEAAITYADGCRAIVKAGAMATIGEKSPCAGGPMLVEAGPASAQLIGIPDWPPAAYVAGAGVAVIVGAIIYGLSGAISD